MGRAGRRNRTNAGDVRAYVDLYSDDVVWGVPNLPDAKSPEQIGSLLRKILGKVAQTIDVTIDVSSSTTIWQS